MCEGGISSLQIIKLAVSLATPIAVVVIGYSLNKRLKSIDEAQWQNRKIIEKRLVIYDEIAPDLNLIFCFCHFLGYWKDITPKHMLEAKRRLDKHVNIYRHLLSEEFYHSYDEFIHTTFRTYTGHGKDALIRSHISNGWGDRRLHANYNWDETYEAMFATSDIPPDKDFKGKYLGAMHALRNCIGLKNS